MHSAKHQHHSKNLTKFHYFFVVFILLIAPLIVLFLTQKNKQTTTPDQSEAASTLPQSRAMKVMEISYLMGSGDGAMVSSVSNSLKQSIVEASKSKGSGTAVISGVNTVHSVTRNGPRPAGSSWQAGLQTIIDQDNLCQKIIDEKVDQVWIWVDPNRDTVNGFNQEYAISSSWMPGNTGNRVDLCGGQRSFMVLGLQYTVEAEFAMHSLGHALEALIPVMQNSDLFWTKWSGSSGSTNPANICGDVHYPPGIPVDYGYDDTRTFTNRCQNWSPDGTEVTNQATCSVWNCNQMGYMKWWMQRMPQRSQNFNYNGKKIPTWLDFLVDFENTVTYYVQNNYFINPHFAQFVTPEAVEKVSSATQQGQASSMSFAHTATGNNRLVLLTASYRAINQSADDKISGATYAGTPLTYVRRNQKGEYTTEIWYATGSIANSGNVVVNFGGSVQDKVVSAISFSDIDQSAPFQNNSGAENGNTGGNGSTTNKTVSISVPSGSNQIVVGVLSTFTGGNTVQLLDPTQVLYAKDSDNVFGRGGVQSSTGGTVPVSWQMTADWPWSATGVSLKKNTSTSLPSTTPTSTPTTPPSPPPATSTPVPGGTPPAIPSLSAPANNVTLSDFTPTFTWTKPARATSYRLQVSENSSFSNTTINTTVTTLTYTPTTDLAGGKTYYWRVQGINSAGSAGSWSTVRSFHLISGAVPTLQVPSNNSTVSELRPSFDWSDVPGATGYQIQISTSSTFSSSIVNVVTSTSNYVATINLAKNKLHYWRVRPKFGKVNGVMSTGSTFTSANPSNTPVNHLPKTGSILTESTSRTNNVLRPRISWITTDTATVADPVSYDIQIAKNNTFTTMVLEKTVSGTDLGGSTAKSLRRYWDVDRNLENATTYYWRVRSSSSSGHKSSWSKAFSLKVPLATPTGLSSPANNSTSNSLRPTFDWADVPGARSYSIYIKYGTGTEILLATTKAATATVPSPSTYTPTVNLKKSSQVTWRVRANSPSYGNVFSSTSVFNTPN